MLIPSGARNEGWFDPWSLLSAFRKKSISMGVHYLHGELETIGTEENRVKNVEVSVSLCHTHDFMRSSDSQTLSRPSFPHAAYWKQLVRWACETSQDLYTIPDEGLQIVLLIPSRLRLVFGPNHCVK